MKKYFTKEATIGLVTLISLFVLYIGVNYLKGINLFKPTNHYYVVMENVTELQKSSPVYINGFKIGLVNEINYEYNDHGKIVVLISLNESMKIKTGSYMELKSGLTSGGSLNLVLNDYVTTYCQIGDTIEGRSNPGLMDKISNDLLPQAENLLPKLDSILTGIQTIVNHPAFIESLNHIEATTANLEKTTARLNMLMANDVPVIMSDFKHISSDFSLFSSNLKELDLKSTFNTVDLTMQNVQLLTKQLNSKDNTFGLFLNDRKLYDNLNSTAENASLLLFDLKQNPKRYVHFSVF